MLRSTVLAVSCVLVSASGAFAQQKIGGCSVLPADNIWNTPVDTLPVRADSATLINTIGASKGLHPDFGGGLWNGAPMGIPFITVSGSQTKYPVSFDYPSESDPGPYAIPLNAPIEGGSNSTGDRHTLAVDTTNCILYELYYAFPDASGWNASSGAIFDLKSNALRPDGWTSTDAAGLPVVPGLVNYDEVLTGEIKHAIRFTAPQTRREYVWPARHLASSLTGAQYPRMGERLRLKASFDVSPYPAEVQVILRAMKKYGIILADNGSAWYITGKGDDRWNNDDLARLGSVLGSNFEVVDAATLMIDPNSGAAKQSSASVSVSVTPASATVTSGAAQNFTATVTGASGGVTWSVNGVNGGNTTVGTIDSNGRYVAPAAVPSPNVVTVRATSTASSSASGTAAVTVAAAQQSASTITAIAPTSIPVGPFTLTITGTGFVSGATVYFDNVALSTSIQSSTSVKATGSASTAKTAQVYVKTSAGNSNTVSVTVTNPQSSIAVVVSPASASLKVRRWRQFSATVTGTSNTAVRWSVNGIVGGNSTVGVITTSGFYFAPTSVPNPATVTVRATSVADSSKSASASVIVTR